MRIVGAMLVVLVLSAWSATIQSFMLISAGRPSTLLLALGALIIETVALMVSHWGRTRRGLGLVDSMNAIEDSVALSDTAKEALLHASVATGHEEPPRLLFSESSGVNAAILGRPCDASWAVIVTRGFLRLSQPEQTVAHVNLIMRRTHRVFSWAFANFLLLMISIELAVFGIVVALLLRGGPQAPSVVLVVIQVGMSILLLACSMRAYIFVEHRLATLGDENALFRTKDPVSAVSGLVKAATIGTQLEGCDNYWHHLFWCMPQSFGYKVTHMRINMLEAIAGVSALGVRASAEAAVHPRVHNGEKAATA